MDHSQNGEATIVKQYFNGYVGTLLSLGENDGITFSNSYDLIQEGWTAHLFEPSTVCGDLYFRHKDNPRVHIYNSGIAAESGDRDFFESGAHVKGGSDKSLVSTAVKHETKKWPDVNFRQRVASFIGFKDWWNYYESPILDFITIDCEGMDWEILQQIDLKAVGCRCLVIEWNSDPALKFNYIRYTQQYGMKLISSNAENLIFAL